jgi:hypothetical protein
MRTAKIAKITTEAAAVATVKSTCFRRTGYDDHGATGSMLNVAAASFTAKKNDLCVCVCVCNYSHRRGNWRMLRARFFFLYLLLLLYTPVLVKLALGGRTSERSGGNK